MYIPHISFFFFFFEYGGQTWKRSGLTPGSRLKSHSRGIWGKHTVYHILKLGLPHARQMYYPLYYFSSPYTTASVSICLLLFIWIISMSWLLYMANEHRYAFICFLICLIVYWAISRGVQGLFVALHSGIILGSTLGGRMGCWRLNLG